MNAQDILRINYAFEESKCAIAEQIYKATKQFIAQPHHMNFYDLLTYKGLSDKLVSKVIDTLPPLKQLVEPEMWRKLISDQQFLHLATLAASYPQQRSGVIYNWEEFELQMQQRHQPVAVNRFFYRSVLLDSLNLLIMELVAPIDGFDGLTDMYFTLSAEAVDLLIFFQPLQPEKFDDHIQNVSVHKEEPALDNAEKALAALKYHLDDWKIYILDAMAKYNKKYCHFDNNKVTFAELFCNSDFNGNFWRNLVEDLLENCNEITDQENLYINQFYKISGIAQTILEGGIREQVDCPYIDLKVNVVFPDKKIKKIGVFLEGFKKNDGFKVFIINCVEPDFPLPELPLLTLDENIIYCFRFMTAAELKKKKLQIAAG